MYQVYKINEERLAAAALRMLKRAVKIMVAAYLVLMFYLALRLQQGWEMLLMSTIGFIPLCLLALLLGYALLKQAYSTFSIVLDDEGVEFHIRGNHKKIKWGDVNRIDKADGTVELHDHHVSAIIRILTGEGSIQLIPEIERFDELLAEINKFKTAH